MRFELLLLLVNVLCVLVPGLKFNGVRKEKIEITKQGSLGVRLGSDFKVLEVISTDSMLQLEDRITAIDGETVTDLEFHEFKQILASAEVPFVLSIERLYLDVDGVQDKKESVQFMDNNHHSDITISPALATLGNELGLHLPIVSVKGGKTVDLLNFISEAAAFSGPFSCEYHSLELATPLDGCHLEASVKKKRIYKDAILLVKRGVCPFVAKALHAQDAGAKGIIIMNTEEKIFPIRDPQASKATIPIVMVTQSQGKQILDMVTGVGAKLSKNIHITTRIAPPNACLGARQRELQLKDQGLTHAQKVQTATTTIPRSTTTTLDTNTAAAAAKDEEGGPQGNAVGSATVEVVNSLHSSALQALVEFNDRKEKEKQESIQHETDAHWIAKSSQGAHGFALSTGATAESSEQSSGAAKEDKHGAYALSEVSTPGFGYFTLGPKNCSFSEDGGADSAGSQHSTEVTVVEYKVLQGTIDQASLGHGGEVAAVYARLPYHTSSAAKEEEEEEERGQGAAVMEAGYVATLQTHLDLFHQQIHSIHTGSLKSQPTVLIIDFTPLHQSEVMPAMKGRRPDTDVFQMDTLDVLGTLLSLLEGGDEGGGGCQGIFFLSLPKNSANDSPLDHMNSMATAQLALEFYNWSYPVMREFHRAVQERGEESTRSDGGDSGNPTPPSVLPLAVIPTLKSAQIRQRFLSPLEPLSLTVMSANWDHCSSSSTSSSSFSRDCGSHGDSNTLRKKWLDLWAVAGEVGSLPDVRVRKKIFYMMKQKYNGDADALLYLSHTLLASDPAATAASLSLHHRLNKKAAARATAATMRVGGHGKRMQQQHELERDKRRSISRERVAALKAEAQAQAEILKTGKSNAEKPPPRSRPPTDEGSTTVAVDKARTKLHPAGEL